MQIKPLPKPASILLWDRKLREKKCEKVVAFDDELIHLADVLKSTCYGLHGAGISAPQIGDFRQVCLVNYPEDEQPLLLVNPVVDEIKSKGEQIDFEGCLSIPGASCAGEKVRNVARVRRCNEIFFTYQDIHGELHEERATGMLARIISHEVDHLSGWFFTDRIGDCSRDIIMRQYRNYVSYYQPTS